MSSDTEQELVTLAQAQGATAAVVIDSHEIVVRGDLARMCEEPRCPHYGLATSCPPHVAGPEGFRELMVEHPRALAYKLEAPADVLLTPEVADLMRVVHDVAAAVEKRVQTQGLGRASAFCGGSCKKLFCQQEPDCAVVERGEDCRHPERAHPSMSGYGVDTSALMEAAGWRLKRVDGGAERSTDGMGTLCGLVLLRL